MEKIICAMWAPPGQTAEEFGDRLKQRRPPRLKAAGAKGIRLNVRDRAIEPAAALTQRWQERQQDGVAQFWVPSAHAMFRAPIDALFSNECDRFEAWLVTESTVIGNRDHPPQNGARTWGWSQASFITFRADISSTQAIDHWIGHHTPGHDKSSA